MSKVLLPELEVGTVIIMDNWSVHKGEEVRKLVENHGCTLMYLPTYSPDFNPIEYLFSKVKAFLRKIRPTTIEQLTDAFADAVMTITPEDTSNTFAHCGYV